MNHREFLLTWGISEAGNVVEVEAMEVFSAEDGHRQPGIHHATEPERSQFAQWLCLNNGGKVVCHLRNGTTADGRVFHVKMCFGRGLILTGAAVRASCERSRNHQLSLSRQLRQLAELAAKLAYEVPLIVIFSTSHSEHEPL